MTATMRPMPVLDRLMAHVVKEPGPDGHWLWQGALTHDGYAQAIFGSRRDGSRRTRYVHLVVWELLVGRIRKGLEAHHVCEVRSCVRPDHLRMLTRLQHAREHARLRREALTSV